MRTYKYSLALVAALVIAACTSKKTPANKISLAYPALGAIMNTQLGLILEDGELLRAQGFDPSISSMGTGKELKVAMISGRADVILTTETNFPVLLGEGFAARAIGSLGSAGHLGLLVKDPAYQALTDLKGQKIATIFGTSVHEPAVQWAKEAGATLVNMGSIASMQSALAAGQVAAIVTWDPYLTVSLENPDYRLLRRGEFDLITVASAKYLDENPEAAAKINQALNAAVEKLRRDRPRVNADFGRISKIAPDLIHRASLKNKNYATDAGSPIENAVGMRLRQKLKASAEFLFNEKIIRRAPDIEAHLVN